MTNSPDILERRITEFWTLFFKKTLFFLKDSNQSLFVSFIHYFIFILGFFYFFFYSMPGDIFRLFFFLIVFTGAISYFTFNKCFITSIELSLYGKKNKIQNFIDKYFGKEIEGNITSKLVLSLSSLIIGLILMKDFGFLNVDNIESISSTIIEK